MTTNPLLPVAEAQAGLYALLTIYDMAKALDRGMTIDGIHLIAKSGGKSEDWRA